MAGQLIRFRRGPSSFLLNTLGNLPEGEPYEAGIIVGDGSVFELLYLGGHDGNNHLLGGGFQTTNGEPAFSAPVGAAAFDTLSELLWISTGSGWLAFCPCVTNSSNPPPTSSSGGGGGGGQVVTSCCPGGLPTTLHVHYTDPNSSSFSLPLVWVAGQQHWSGNTSFGSGTTGQVDYHLTVTVQCSGSVLTCTLQLNSAAVVGTGALPDRSNTLSPTSSTCSPPDFLYPSWTPSGWPSGFSGISLTV